jgi:hypothetical protein
MDRIWQVAQEAQGDRVGVQKLGSLGVGDGSYMAGSPDGALTHHTTTEKTVY